MVTLLAVLLPAEASALYYESFVVERDDLTATVAGAPGASQIAITILDFLFDGMAD